VDALIRALKQEIFAGHLAAGSSLRESELCAQYGVSRHSLRNALQVLVQAGLASQEPNRSVRVATLSPAAVDDIYRLRSLIELRAVAMLSERPELRQPAREALQRLRALSPEAPWSEVREFDLAFHTALIDGMDSPRASQVFTSLLDELRLAFLQMQGELEDPAQVIGQHQEIFDLIESGDREAAIRLAGEHLEAARTTIIAGLKTSE
jgi:DNA-binding GntR family transcriptional regulator